LHVDSPVKIDHDEY